MSALVTRCISIWSKCRALYRACVLELGSFGKIVQNRHILAALSQKNTVFVVDLHVRPRHEHFTAGNIDNEVRAVGDLDIELEVVAFNVAHIEYLHLIRCKVQHIEVFVRALDGPAVVIVLIYFQCSIRCLRSEVLTALLEESEFCIEVDELAHKKLGLTIAYVVHDLGTYRALASHNEAFVLRLEVGQRVAANDYLRHFGVRFKSRTD